MYLNRHIETTIRRELKNYTLPIVVSGTRQVGKSTTILHVLKDFDYIELNLHTDERLIEMFEMKNKNIDNIINEIYILTGKAITDETVLFIDEIQISEQAFSCLKVFAEKANFRVIASGSNVGPVANNFESSLFPVGKFIEYHMYPLSFSEFLLAIDNEHLLKLLINGLIKFDISNNLHNLVMENFLIYLRIGGMPRVVCEYIANGDYEKFQEMLIQNYMNDFSKYAAPKDVKYLRTIYDELETFLGEENQDFNASKIGLRTDLLRDTFDWISLSRTIIMCYKISDINLPLSSSKSKKRKFFYNDTGLLVKKCNYDYDLVKKASDMRFYGVIMENYIATVLIKYQRKIFYFQKNKTEIDFIIDRKDYVLPIEVKSGNNLQAKSLNQFIKDYQPDVAIKLTKNNISRTDTIFNIPLYAIDLILEYNISGYGLDSINKGIDKPIIKQ